MRIVLAALGVLLAAALLWLLTRQAGRPAITAQPPSGVIITPTAEGAGTVDPLPELERSALPTAEDKARDFFAGLPSTALTVRILDPYEVLTAPCRLRVETRLPDSRRAGVTKSVDALGECRFSRVPAGQSWITLLRAPAVGGEEVHLFEQTLELVAGEDREFVMDLNQQVVVVDLECSNPPEEGFDAIRLLADGTRIAFWPRAGLASPPLRVWIPRNTPLAATFSLSGASFSAARTFEEPGWKVWSVELPAGSLHVSWPASAGMRKFQLTTEPFRKWGFSETTNPCSEGRYSFLWLLPGRYHLQVSSGTQGSVIRGEDCLVDVGSEPIYLDLQSRPAGTLRFDWPAPPGTVPANSPVTATVYPRGAWWPRYATGAFFQTNAGTIEGLPTGDYDLVIVQSSWISRTPVTVVAAESAPVRLQAWRRLVRLSVTLQSVSARPEPEEARLIDADGATQVLRREGVNQGFAGDIGWSYRAAAPPGSARLLVVASGGKVEQFDFVVADKESDFCFLQLPD